ncbi:MAG: hypothetical protein PHE06_03300 [Lachnospiraceae bacterium]|nr:hypothetical protein [Lachnospiraceae bacterium]
MMKAISDERKEKEQEAVRNHILTSMKDIKTGKGREYQQFFDELENRYTQK